MHANPSSIGVDLHEATPTYRCLNQQLLRVFQNQRCFVKAYVIYQQHRLRPPLWNSIIQLNSKPPKVFQVNILIANASDNCKEVVTNSGHFTEERDVIKLYQVIRVLDFLHPLIIVDYIEEKSSPPTYRNINPGANIF